MLAKQLLLAIIGLSAGTIAAGGLFAFVVELGVISDFADRTHTADKVLLYEDSTMLGGIIGNLLFCYQIPLPFGTWILPWIGALWGIFVGCWAMALAKVLNVFPVFMRRIRIVKYLGIFVIATAIGKGVGACIFFLKGW